MGSEKRLHELNDSFVRLLSRSYAFLEMKVHHLNCGTFHPVGNTLMRPRPRDWVCHCLLVETSAGLVLVDSGMGLQDMKDPKSRMGSLAKLMRPKLNESDTAVRHVEALGFQKTDVRHIVLTHLDFDHVAGIIDFPQATVHVFGPEFVAALTPTTLIEKRRYRKNLWGHRPKWNTPQMSGEQWYGFDCVNQIEGLPPEILMIPLPGHTLGHCGVAIDSEDGWLLHAGDAYFFHKEMDAHEPSCPLGLQIFQKILEVDDEERIDNQNRLRELARTHHNEITVFCAHDPQEFSRFSDPPK